MKSPKHTVDIRLQNKQIVMRLLCFHEPMSRMEISQDTTLSPGTVTNVTGELLQEGILAKTGLVESVGGRPRTLLTISPNYGYLIGVDLGETHIQLELFNLARQKLGAIRYGIAESGNTPDYYVEQISSGLKELASSTGIKEEAILGIGIGVPGVVEHNGYVSIAAPMWNWQRVEFLNMLEAKINLPVYIDNGAKAMALAESWFGAGRGVEDMAVILLGTGIGAGIITKGSLYRGATNSAGEWGHTKIELNGRPCRCGSQGCVEAYAGAPGIISSLKTLSGESAKQDEDQIVTIKNLVEAYRAGDSSAVQVLHATAHYLGAGLANLVNLFNPELVVIGGWAGLLIGEAIMDELKKYVAQYALAPSAAHLKIDLCQFGQDAICMGAACLVLEEFLSANKKFMRQSVEG
ncbi:MAG: ROK family protein [Chloroflexi bacterium]|nr:ROK family protein [Chloroflexota bacterium]